MPFPMKIQPIDSYTSEEGIRFEPVKPMIKSRLKRLFERQFSSVLKNSAAEKIGVEEPHFSKDSVIGSAEFEPSSVCLAKMVQNFIEGNNEKQSAAIRCGRKRCNCFNRNCNDDSEDELDSFGSFGDSSYPSTGEACEILKSLVPCASVRERNLLADTAKIVEKNKISKHKEDICRKIVTDGLLALGYDASICKSRWEKSPSYPAGEYEYIDVIIEEERIIIDIDFRSEFEIARSTKSYQAILQILPYIFVGRSDRLLSIIAIVSEAAKQSLKKKGMHIPPWRKAEYVKAKWLSPYTRTTPTKMSLDEKNSKLETHQALLRTELSYEESNSVDDNELGESVFTLSEGSEDQEEEEAKVVTGWKPPELKPKSSVTGVKILTGLAAVIEDNP
ncbi:Protein of unknown function (DUF506) [Quillaja saponaria]|uniref:Uncharacterized protein n=1 Tax=Quillaja saponaria TaxID=32244 RepID=A0AAD7Q9D4_QUISA|nr:Protein of unknown function (DUF506) [Quillaja saponaria]